MKDQVTIYEAWGRVEWDGPYACTFSTVEGCADMLAQGLMNDFDDPPNPLVPLFSVRAKSWEDAMTIYHEIQGWEPYKPLV